MIKIIALFHGIGETSRKARTDEEREPTVLGTNCKLSQEIEWRYLDRELESATMTHLANNTFPL